MEPNKLYELWESSNDFQEIVQMIEKKQGALALLGMPSSPAIHLIGALAQKQSSPLILVTQTEKEAMQYADDLRLICEQVAYFPAREIQLQHYMASSRDTLQKRMQVLVQLYQNDLQICVCSIESTMQAMATPESMQEMLYTISVGDTIDLENFAKRLLIMGYERVEQVSGVGQFRLSGSIVDVYSPSQEYPVRIDFFDEEIDSMRLFDTATQRGIDNIRHCMLMSATEVPQTTEAQKRALKQIAKAQKNDINERMHEVLQSLGERIEKNEWIDSPEEYISLFYEPTSFFEHVSSDSCIVLLDSVRLEEHAKTISKMFTEQVAQHMENGDVFSQQAELILSPSFVFGCIKHEKLVAVDGLSRSASFVKPKSVFSPDIRTAIQYNASISILAQDIQRMSKKEHILLFAGKRAETLQQDLAALDVESILISHYTNAAPKEKVLVIGQSIPKGFTYPDLALRVFSEQDIYGTQKQKTKLKRKTHTNKADLFAELTIGDYVVHEKYGIGVFQGIETHKAGNITRDYLMIQYAAQDRVGVVTDELDRVQKYIGSGERVPRISKLGGSDWRKTVSKARESVQELAFDLVAVYAEREAQTGYAFSPDTVWQRQMEDSFPYEETPGQLQSIKEIKHDMESNRVMDRLLCGDVGYGKTEVALRAAFKATQDSKQVAFLAPTTILAQQHFLTLKKRFKDFPIEIEMLSRLRTPTQQKKILQRLREGRIDILVGTHRLLGKDVEFKDIGLLIVDEEQRFGVGHKEQIKAIKNHVDVLTLTATPIPRTLHMSMLGIRDMSVIDTPPEERYPITTYVMEFDESIIAEAIRRELLHGGQCYVLYNHVARMEEMVSQMQEIVPEATFVMAHGQMRQGELEKTMISFLNGEADVLVCSTIIESGVDIPNVNTLIVYDADRFGLSQLYQIRGRVGRSNRKAYAYLTFRRDKVLKAEAEKRLQAIREFTEFGSGFKIALQDLEIRGAGNLLGPQQHGRMNEVGYDYYCRIIEESVNEIRGKQPTLQVETQIDVPLDAFISKEYITQEPQRLEMYKRIASVKEEQDVLDVQDELLDRFGDIPEETQNLLQISLVKSYANMAQIEQISIQKNKCTMRFHTHSTMDFSEIADVMSSRNGWKFAPHKNCMKVEYITNNQKIYDTIDECKAFFLQIFAKNGLHLCV